MKKAFACALGTGGYFAKAASEFSALKSNVEDSAHDVRRIVRKARHVTENFVDDVTIAVKKQPLTCAGLAFGCGIGIGTLAGWFGRRK